MSCILSTAKSMSRGGMRNNMYEIVVTLEDDVTEKNAKELLELIRKIPEVA